MRLHRPAALLAGGELPAQPRPASPGPAPATSRAQPTAEALIAAATAALGPASAQARALSLQAEHTGWYYALEQARDGREPWARVRRGLRWSIDADGGRLRREAEQLFPGGVRFLTAQGLSATGGWQADLLKWRTGKDLQSFGPSEASAARAQFERLFPHLLLRQLKAASASASIGGGLSYRDAAGETIEVFFDPVTGLPSRAAQVRNGLVQTELVYADYESREGVMLPRSLQIRQGGQLQEDLRLGRVRFAQASEAAFSPPAGYAPPPPPGAPRLRALAAGIYMFENMPADYRSMLVDTGEGLVVLEAPLNPAYGEKQIELVRQAFPGQPVSHVVVTHAHGDHTGGLKPWVEAGAVILAPRGSAVALRRQLAARQVTRPVRIEEVDARRAIGAGPGRLDLHGFETSHAEANLFAHLPSARVLFQGDLLYVPVRGEVPPAFEVVADFMRELRRLRLAPLTIVGVHGRPATWDEAQLSLRRSAR